jgi:hypothetical protein
MGYISTGEKTGWPLFTRRYDGAFVAGLYGADPAIESGRTIDAAIPTATSEEPGMYAEAAVDGSDATIRAPTDTTASVTVDLGARTRLDDARYVRVTLTRHADAPSTGIREVVATAR